MRENRRPTGALCTRASLSLKYNKIKCHCCGPPLTAAQCSQLPIKPERKEIRRKSQTLNAKSLFAICPSVCVCVCGSRMALAYTRRFHGCMIVVTYVSIVNCHCSLFNACNGINHQNHVTARTERQKRKHTQTLTHTQVHISI